MTTTSIPLSALPPAIDSKWRRDQWGRYLILPPPPNDEKPLGYTRVTTVADALDNGYGLPPWLATMAICGTVMRPGLRAQWEALMAQYGDPWYAGEDPKKECKKLVEECAAVGGANDRSEIGTALHKVMELIALGRTPEYLSEETLRDVEAYQAALDAAGIKILPGMIELTVVLDEHRVAGTFDLLTVAPGFDLPLVTDLKTGHDLSRNWQKIATQVSIYSRGDALYRQGPATDGSEDVRTPMPEVDPNNGLIIWLNAGTGQCSLWLVDLKAGWESFSHSMWAREWAKREVARPLAEGPFGDDLAPALEASLVAVGMEQIDIDLGLIDVDQVHRIASEMTHGEKLRAWLQGRIDVIGKHEQARTDLGASWPPGLPTLRQSTDHDEDQLAAIEKLLNAVERRHKLAFPDPRPDPVAQVLEMFPNAAVVK